MAITNTTPITVGSPNIYWVTQLTLQPTTVQATLVPSDGTYLIGNPSLQKRVLDKTTPAIIGEVYTALQTITSKTSLPVFVNIIAQDPTKPIQLVANFGSEGSYFVKDVFGTLGSNTTFTTVYANVLTYLATKV